MNKKRFTIYIIVAMSLCLNGCSRVKEIKSENEGSAWENEKITVVLDWTPNTNHTGLYLAQEKGYFEAEGLEVEIIQPPEDGAAILVAGGGAEFGIDFQEYLAPAFASADPLPVTAVAAIIQHNTSGFISLKENGIVTPKDMAGYTYASWDMPVEKAILKDMIEKDGGKFEDVKMIPSTVTDLVTALQTDVDLVWIYYAWDGIAAQVQEIETNYINLADVSKELDFYSPVIIANNDYLKSNPAQAKAFLKAVQKGYQDAIDKPEEAAQRLCDAVPELDLEIVTKSQQWLANKYVESGQWGRIEAARWDGFYRWLYDRAVIEQEIPAGFGFSNEYLPQQEAK